MIICVLLVFPNNHNISILFSLTVLSIYIVTRKKKIHHTNLVYCYFRNKNLIYYDHILDYYPLFWFGHES